MKPEGRPAGKRAGDIAADDPDTAQANFDAGLKHVLHVPKTAIAKHPSKAPKGRPLESH